MGLLYDPAAGRQRVVYAFIGTLSWSRYKFVEFVWSQDQRGFVGSHLKMFDFWGGASQLLVIDNLKSGGLRPDRYDPQLNPLYRQMAEHYGCFIDPARPGQPQDKGKVERLLHQARFDNPQCLEDFDASLSTGLDPTLLRELATAGLSITGRG